MKPIFNIVAAAGLSLLALSPIQAAAEREFDGVTLRVATWGGSWRDRMQELIGTEFEKRGGKVDYVVGNALENFSKLIAARGQEAPFDLIEFQSDLWRPLVDAGFLQPVERERLPNLQGDDAIDEDGVSVRTFTLEEGIAYNADKFRELGIEPPKKYSDLFDEKLKGRIGWPDISYGPYALIGLAVENGGSETDIQPGLDALGKVGVDYFYKSSVELSTKFASGDVWAAPWHAGWAVRVQRTDVPIAMSFPEVGKSQGIQANGMIGIVKGTKLQEAAEFWINTYLSPAVQEQLGRSNGVAPVNAEALGSLKQDPVLDKLMKLTPEDISNMYHINWKGIDLSDIVGKWNRMVRQ